MQKLSISFIAPMVCGILREIERPGRGKTQTRRVLTAHCDQAPAFVDGGAIMAFDEHEKLYRWPNTKAVGDRLYVREAWRASSHYDDLSPSEMGGDESVRYEADGSACAWNFAVQHPGRFRHGMHMPRWASRITLIVTDVRVQRLQEISEADAIAEGLEHDIDGDVGEYGRHYVIEKWRGADFLPWISDPIEAFADLWDHLNHARGYDWDANPWVATYTFQPILGNIDTIAEKGEQPT